MSKYIAVALLGLLFAAGSIVCDALATTFFRGTAMHVPMSMLCLFGFANGILVLVGGCIAESIEESK